MSQVTIYLHEEVVRQAKARAKASGKSLSAYVADLLAREHSSRRWPADFVELLSDGQGTLEAPEDLPVDDVSSLD